MLFGLACFLVWLQLWVGYLLVRFLPMSDRTAACIIAVVSLISISFSAYHIIGV